MEICKAIHVDYFMKVLRKVIKNKGTGRRQYPKYDN
jgi:hypothetical protein